MTQHSPHWEHFEHGADVGVRGYGNTVAQAFEQAALGLIAIVTEPQRVSATHEVDVHCEADDVELLFVDWLNALICEMATRRLVFGRFEVSLDATRIRGRAWGEPVSPDRHEPVVEAKGATYTQLRVAREGEQWIAQTVIDV